MTPQEHENDWRNMLRRTGIDGPYVLVSPGPDKTEDILPSYNPQVYAISNGLVSPGDIVFTDSGVVGLGS